MRNVSYNGKIMYEDIMYEDPQGQPEYKFDHLTRPGKSR
jgi:hypothetical protein